MSKTKRKGFFSYGGSENVTEKKKTDVEQKPAENNDLAECCRKLTDISEKLQRRVGNHDAALDDHNSRLVHLEQAVFKSEQKPEEIKKAEAVEDTKSVKEEEKKKTAKAVEIESAKLEEPAKTETVKKTIAESKEAGIPVKDVLKTKDGPHKVWMYWDYEHECWRGPKMSIGTALSAVGHDYSLVKEVCVWIKNNGVVRMLTPEEIERFIP